MGTEYNPQQKNSLNSYLEKDIFIAGWNFKIQENVNIWFDLSFRKSLFTEQLQLESTGISYRINNWNFIYRSNQLEIGVKSEIFNKNLNSANYDRPVLEDYKFRGIEVIREMGNFNFSVMTGGNSFNSAIGKVALGYSNITHNFDLFYLYCKHDRIYTYPMHAVGFELISELTPVRFYNSLVYENLISKNEVRKSCERFVNLSEMIIHPVRNFNVGMNFLYTIFDWNDEKEWESTSFAELIIRKSTNTISYKYWNSDMGFYREINLINSYNILPYWSLASNISYISPSIGNDYYIFGFQTIIEYEMD